MRINDLLLESTHPLYESVLPTYHPAVRMGEDLARSLMEAQLTAQQVQALFTQVQQQVDAGGGNRTIAGKGVDAAKKLKAIYDYAKRVTQDSGPVKGFDGAFEKLAAELKEKSGGDTGAMRYVQKYRDFAKAHPVAQKAIYATLVLAVGVAGYVGMGPAYLVLKPAVVGIMKFTDKLLQGEKFSSAAIAGAETFAIADIAASIGAGLKSVMGGGVPTSVPKPIGGGAAVDAAPSAAQPTGASAADAGEKPSVAAAKRAAAMQAVSDKSEPTPTNPATTPVTKPFSGPGTFDPTTKQWKPYVSPNATPAASAAPETPSVAPAQTSYEKLSSNPKINRVLSSVEKDIGDEMKSYKGKDYIEHFRKLAANKLEVSLPNDLALDTADRQAAARTLVQKAMDATISASPELSKVSGKVTDSLITLVKDGTILKTLKTDDDLQKFITRGIKSYAGSLHDADKIVGNPSIEMMLRQDINNQINQFIEQGVDSGRLDTKDFKGDSFKLNAIIKMLKTQESIDLDRPALTESQVMEAFRGTIFAPTLLTEAQVKHLFQKLEEGPIWDKIKSAGGAIAGSKFGQAAVKGAAAAGQKIATGAGNLTNKVTADKLMSAWKKAGSPTDSTAVYQFLKTQGIDEIMLKTAFKAAKIPVGRTKKVAAKTDTVSGTAAGTTPSGVPAISQQYSAALAQIQKLPATEKQKAVKYIQTRLATA